MATAGGASQPLIRAWLRPANVITEARLLSVPVIVAAVAMRAFGWALLLFVLAGLSDGFDGWLARRSPAPRGAPPIYSQLGEYLDPIADKALLSSLFIVLAIVGAFPWLLTILVFTRDLSILVAAVWIYRSTGFRDFRPTYVGKINTVMEIVTIGLALLYQVWPVTLVSWLERLGWALVFILAYGSGIHYAFTCAHRYHRARAA